MIEFIYDQILFYASIAFLLFVPGYFFMLAVWGKENRFSSVEKTVLSFGSSVIIVDFLMLIMGRLDIPLGKMSIAGSVFLFAALSLSLYLIREKFGAFRKNESEPKKTGFSYFQTIAIISILFLTVFIKTAYLTNTVFPTSTDLGHHMYWSKVITDTEKLPTYEESDVIASGEGYTISEPEAIADFIIGEHLIFAAISSLSGADFVSAFPSLILFIINIASVLAVFALALEIFRKYPQGVNIAIAVLFFIGPIYALSSPQAKFVSGGVIGNMFGNFFIPLALLFFIKALREKKSVLLATAMFIVLGLAFTHHLSTFIFIFSLAFTFLLFCIFNFKNLFSHIKDWLRLLFSPWVLGVLAFGIAMVFLVHTPSYLNPSAVDTAVGTPSKSTRTGLTFSQLTSTAGQARMIFGLLGLAILLFSKEHKKYGSAFILGWAVALFVMSLKPSLLYVDIPSNRIASYIIFPLAILSGFALIRIFEWTKNSLSHQSLLINPSYIIVMFFIFAVFLTQGGFTDNSSSLSHGGNTQSAIQTFHASGYLADFADKEKDVVLKDHNYLTADAWIKLYFMNGYNYPFSRGFFKRYEDPIKVREQCTLQMISFPSSTEAKKCFDGTGTNFLMVHPQFDGTQFRKTRNFWQVYSSNELTIFHKPQ